MNEHSETIPGERTSRTPVVQQHARTAECDGFHGRCPASADGTQFGPERVGAIAGTMAVYERDKAASELASLRAHAASLAEDLDDAGATIADCREALAVMQRERDAAHTRIAELEAQLADAVNPTAQDYDHAAEILKVADAANVVLDAFTRGSDGYRARLSGVTLMRAYKAIGRPVPGHLKHLEGQ